MTTLLAYILLHYRYPQAGAFAGLQYALLEVNAHCRVEYLELVYL